MKRTLAALLLTGLAACASDPGTRSVVAPFAGTNLNVIWSPTSDKKATIILADRGAGTLPVNLVQTDAFRAFFVQTTGCRVAEGARIDITRTSSGPFSILVPKVCPA